MTPRGTLGLCCVYIAQLMTHTAIYTLPFTLQLCYKPFGILKRVTRSQRVHISSHDRLYTSTKNYFFIFICNRLLLILKKSRKIGSLTRPQPRLNSISNGLLLILKKSRKIGFAIRSQFRVNLHSK